MKRATDAELEALRRYDDLVATQKDLRLRNELLWTVARSEPEQTAGRFLKALLPRTNAGFAAICGDDGRIVASRGAVDSSQPLEPIITFQGGYLAGTGVEELLNQSPNTARFLADIAVLIPMRPTGPRSSESIAELKLDLQSELAIVDDLARNLPGYLDRVCRVVGCDRASLFISPSGEESRRVATGGANSETLRTLEQDALAGLAETRSRRIPLDRKAGAQASLVLAAAQPIAGSEGSDRFLEWVANHLSVVLKQSAGQIALQRDARRDRLTGLGNRLWFDVQLQHAVTDSQETFRPVSLIIIDIDHFKRVNDTFGHQAGDRAIQAVAGILRNVAQNAREHDCIETARYGGEELAVLLPGLALPATRRIAESIRAGVEGIDLEWDGEPIRLTASAGFATMRAEEASGAELIRRADACLYAAKQGGRNRVRGIDVDGTEWPTARPRELAHA